MPPFFMGTIVWKAALSTHNQNKEIGKEESARALADMQNAELRKFTYAIHVRTRRLYLETDFSVHAFEEGVPLDRAGKHFLDMRMSSSFFAEDDDIRLIAYRHGARLVRVHRKEDKEDLFPINPEDLPPAPYNPDVNAYFLLLKQSNRKKYGYALCHEKVIVAVQIDEGTHTIRYAVGRPRSRRDDYYFLSFTDRMTYRRWIDLLPEQAQKIWSPVYVSFKGLVRIARDHGTILCLDDLRYFLTGESLREILKHENAKKGNKQEIEK